VVYYRASKITISIIYCLRWLLALWLLALWLLALWLPALWLLALWLPAPPPGCLG